MLRGLGLGFENIYACLNDCVLFYKEHEKGTSVLCIMSQDISTVFASRERGSSISVALQNYPIGLFDRKTSHEICVLLFGLEWPLPVLLS